MYQVVPGTLTVHEKSKITADLVNTHTDMLYVMEVTVYPHRILRLKIDEKTPLKPRYPTFSYISLLLQLYTLSSFLPLFLSPLLLPPTHPPPSHHFYARIDLLTYEAKDVLVDGLKNIPIDDIIQEAGILTLSSSH